MPPRPHISTTSRRQGLRIRSTRPRLALLAVTALVCVSTGCGTDDDGSRSGEPNTGTSQTSEPALDSPLAQARQQFEDALAGHSGALTTDGLPTKPPASFIKADVTHFADQILTIVERGISPDIEDKTAENAINYVLGTQYPGTVLDYKATMKRVAGNLRWQFVLASRFDTAPTEPASILVSRWKVRTEEGTLYNGTKAPFLVVTFETLIRHDVPTDGPPGSTTPIVVERTISMSGFRPRGGETWWPGLRTSAATYGDDGCALAHDGTLRPATTVKRFNESRKNVSEALSRDEIVISTKASNPRDLRKGSKRDC